MVQGKDKEINLTITGYAKHKLWLQIGFDADVDLSIEPNSPSLLLNPTPTKKLEEKLTIHNISLILKSDIRGDKQLRDIRVEIRSRLGFWLLRSKQEIKRKIKVYPNIFQDNQQLAASLLLKSKFGLHSQRVVGQGKEFEQLREYLPDDNYSNIAWKAAARKGKPVTKIFQIERTQSIYIAIDHSRSSNFTYGEKSNLDLVLEAILLMQLCCEREGDILGLITFADKVSNFCPAGKGRTHFSTLRNMIYDLTPNLVTPDFENLFIFLRQKIKRRSLILLFTNLDDPGLASNLYNDIHIIKRMHILTICTFNRYENELLFTDKNISESFEIYERLAAQLCNNDQERLLFKLKKLNVDLLRFRPKRFAVGVIEHYLNVKRRQIL
ncbi:MAG: DUF58 domain-containing protein [bacterium]